jgi:hypothetical protein
MSPSTMIFRLCDEDEDLDLAAEPRQHAAEHSPRARRRSHPRQFGFRRAERCNWERSGQPSRGGWVDGEPRTAELAEEPGAEVAPESWDVDPDTATSSALFDWGVEDSDRGGQINADPFASWSAGEHAGAFRAAASTRSWLSHRVAAVGTIAIVALLLVAIGHSARQAGRGSVGQRPVAAAAVGASSGAPLPAPIASSPGGRRPPPQPPAANPAKPRRARRRQRTGTRPRPANRPAPRARVTAATTPASTPTMAPVRASAAGSAPEQAPAPVVVTAPARVRSDPRPRQAASPDSAPGLAEFSFER